MSERKQTRNDEVRSKGYIEAIYTAPEGSVEMKSVEEVTAVEKKGLKGDRYFKETGYWSNNGDCQVTLIEKKSVERIYDEFGIDLTNGEHRRNVVIDGVSVDDLLSERFKIGGAVMTGNEPRPPCSYIESLNEEGTARALEEHGAGMCASVVETGVIRVGDSIEIL